MARPYSRASINSRAVNSPHRHQAGNHHCPPIAGPADGVFLTSPESTPYAKGEFEVTRANSTNTRFSAFVSHLPDVGLCSLPGATLNVLPAPDTRPLRSTVVSRCLNDSFINT